MATVPDALKTQFNCPLSQDLMQDPVTENTACGHTFDRIWITQWVTDNPTCPLSRDVLTIANLQPNAIIARACAILGRDELVSEEDLTFLQQAAETLNDHARYREDLHPIRQAILEKLQAVERVARAATGAATTCVRRIS